MNSPPKKSIGKSDRKKKPAIAAPPVKAYRDEAFMDGPDGRPVRILAEYLEPRERFDSRNISDTILFFGSSRIVSEDEARKELEAVKKAGGDIRHAEQRLRMSAYYEATRELAGRLTQWSKGLKDKRRRFVICSGGGPGIMEAANRGASETRGDNIGLGISLPFEQSSNPWITRELAFEFHYFFMRKFWFLYLAKAVIIMPGGFGTLDELFEALTLVQTRKIKKRLPIILFGSEFWDRIVDLDALAEYGTISLEDLAFVHKTDSVEEAFHFITRELAEYALQHPGPSL